MYNYQERNVATYLKEELISSTNIVRKFGSILKSLVSHEKEKIAIVKNNEIEAVMVPVDVYEKLQEAYDLLEHTMIYQTIKEREKTSESDFIPFDDVLKEAGLSKDDL
jgi:PHD/YefM family antitoxin component YafN of YafNO toxin-antitoxin module